MLANMAADYVVNWTIKEADPNGNITAMPDSALFDIKYANMTTKQVFDLLKQEAEQNGGGDHLADRLGDLRGSATHRRGSNWFSWSIVKARPDHPITASA